jgi:membrane protein required for beta-lactamase induction
MVIATVLLVIQTAVLGLMLLSSLLEGIMTVNVPALLMGLLIFGIPVGLQVAVLYHLYQFKTGNSKAFASDWNAREPWE